MTFRVGMAQINPLVGDIPGNTDRVLAQALLASQAGVQLLVFPELCLTGYPPEDLLLRPALDGRIAQALQRLCCELPPALWVVCGYPARRDGALHNLAGVIHGGRVVVEYAKQHLPNDRVFDEKRYFCAGSQAACVVDMDGLAVALTVCEDIWQPEPARQAAAAGAQLLVNLSASPFHAGKPQQRLAVLRQRVVESGLPLIYVNQVGGQDELVFDGASLALNRQGQLCAAAPFCAEALTVVEMQDADLNAGEVTAWPETEAAVYRVLVTGLRDYVEKNGFPSVLLGLSGGIDSALTLAIAVDALGAERVAAVMMPFHYTSAISLEDAEAQARTLGVAYSVLPIAEAVQAFGRILQPALDGLPQGLTQQNIQARCRGLLLMALSNAHGALVLTTGNKSEVAVGYSTLYGDMAGGLDVLKDVPKTLVYALARYRNTVQPVIPERVIERAPSAELAPDQRDSDSLPDYDVLDAILRRYVDGDESLTQIVAAGFDRDTVARVIRLVDRNEYKRRQAAIGIRISERAFGRDRRYPMTSGWQAGD